MKILKKVHDVASDPNFSRNGLVNVILLSYSYYLKWTIFYTMIQVYVTFYR